MSERTRERNKGLIRVGLQLIKGLVAVLAGAGAEKALGVIDAVMNLI